MLQKYDILTLSKEAFNFEMFEMQFSNICVTELHYLKRNTPFWILNYFVSFHIMGQFDWKNNKKEKLIKSLKTKVFYNFWAIKYFYQANLYWHQKNLTVFFFIVYFFILLVGKIDILVT